MYIGGSSQFLFNFASEYICKKSHKIRKRQNVHLMLHVIYYGQAISVQALRGPQGSRRLRLPGFLNNWHMQVARLSAQCTGYLYSPGDIPGTRFCSRLSQPQRHSVARRIKSVKNLKYATENQTCDLPACSRLPQSTALLCTQVYYEQT